MSWRFLIDASVPVALARAIAAAGYPATHVADLGKAREDDIDIWHLAATRGEVRKRALLQRVTTALPDIVAALDAGERIVEVR